MNVASSSGCIVEPKALPLQMCKAIKKDLADGGRAYFIFPRIESKANQNMKTVKSEHATYAASNILGKEVAIETIHGQLSASEQNERAKKFKAGDTQVLFATSLVEASYTSNSQAGTQ